SMPIALLPGIGERMRTSLDATAYEKLLLSCRIFSTLTPRPTSISYCVTVGPRENPVTLASTLNCSSTLVICAMVRSVASERVTGGGPALSTPGDGSTYGAAGGCSAFAPGPDVP